MKNPTRISGRDDDLDAYAIAVQPVALAGTTMVYSALGAKIVPPSNAPTAWWKGKGVMFSVGSGDATLTYLMQIDKQSITVPATADWMTVDVRSATVGKGVINAAIVTLNPLDEGQGKDVHYEFTGAKTVFEFRNLAVDSNFGDGVSPLTLRGQLYNVTENRPDSSLDVTCNLLNKTAAFIGKKSAPQTIDLTPTADGNFSAEFTDTATTVSTIDLETEDQSATSPVNYTPLAEPVLTLAFDGDQAPANGTQPITAIATLVEKVSKKPIVGFSLTFTIDGPAKFKGGAAEVSATTGPDGKASVALTSTKQGIGNVTVKVDKAPTYHQSSGYTFTNAWALVDELEMYLSGSEETTATIYANGLHQAEVTLYFVMKDSNGLALTPDNGPTLNQVRASVNLQSYEGGSLFGTGDLQGWELSAESNEFSKQIQGSGTRVQGSAAPQPRADAGDKFPTGGTVTFNYYVTSTTPNPSSVKLGYKIAPTGGNGEYKSIVGGLDNKQDVYVGLKAISAIQYSVTGLNVVANHQTHAGEKDDAPTNTKLSSATIANYWRQWDYILDIDADSKPGSPKLFRAQVSKASVDQGMEKSRRFDGLYEWRLFLWPDNCVDENLNHLPNVGSTSITSDGVGTVKVNCPVEGTSGVGVSLYACFTGVVQTGDWQRVVAVKLWDNYGNSGTVYLNPQMPSKYDTDELKKWPAFLDSRPAGRSTPPASEPRPPLARDPLMVYQLGTVQLYTANPSECVNAGGEYESVSTIRYTGVGSYAHGASDFNLFAPDNPATMYVYKRPYYLSNVSFPWYFLVQDQGYIVVENSRDLDFRSGFLLEPLWGTYPNVALMNIYSALYLTTSADGKPENMLHYAPFTEGSALCRWEVRPAALGHPPWNNNLD